ncbi:SusD/RagB family nutrient-binding outer membrane lipoprotein [Paraflavitalea sp. CAU 1676]|uniref:SusD/RagB family nutrient-binding outer membrane lipoprotein n=1 Tax=Paraflavitalea sp. CAU 1676 TaxID=3032598 RepID=UPI0023DCAE0F|nr:SusD/RagB family nutrient-binding outer membrane lipoprotein [Paraflavitalea sp. CAU 1676]MDF2193336.1 SusD/RagB family nutrient-binding outer membrane lipoprotein [Paraflavitalea sp. CAU 1676]
MKTIHHKLFVIMLAVAVGSGACKKSYLDVNQDPNRVTDDNITAELIFPQAAHATGARSASGNFQFIDNWMGYWSASGDFAIQQDETTYNIDFTFGDLLWQNQYNVLFDLNQVKTKAQAKGEQGLAGASMVLSAKLFQDLVDLFGNIPYSQAFQNDKYTQPTFDDAKAVYSSLQASLDSAIIYLKTPASTSFTAADIVNGGNTDLWIKFANTLKLRMLIRQSEVSGFNPAAEIAKIVANGGVLHAGESIDVNPGYQNAVNKQSPFYANFGLTPTGAEASTATRANQYIVGLMSGTSDPRLSRFFKAPANGGAITGTTYGLAAGNPVGAASSSFGPGLANSSAQAQWILTSFESMFLEAEAIARGWMTGDAQTAYENAVRESFTWLGVPNATTAANTYMASQAIADWDNAGGTALSKAKFITYQKYIALNGVNPLEAWSDLRRLNMIPNKGYISVNPGKLSNSLPNRLLYPQSEYTTNSANVNAQGKIDQFTSKLFWQP